MILKSCTSSARWSFFCSQFSFKIISAVNNIRQRHGQERIWKSAPLTAHRLSESSPFIESDSSFVCSLYLALGFLINITSSNCLVKMASKRCLIAASWRWDISCQLWSLRLWNYYSDFKVFHYEYLWFFNWTGSLYNYDSVSMSLIRSSKLITGVPFISTIH